MERKTTTLDEPPARRRLGGADEAAESTPASPTLPPPLRGDSKRLAQVIGANLRHMRTRLFPGWGGQRKFAEFLDLTPNDVSVYEHGRTAPSELRQAAIAEKLGLTLEELLSPLPDVVVAVRPPEGAEAESTDERYWRERAEEGARRIARLEGRIEVLREQNEALAAKADELREANYALRYMLYGDDTPDARARRERIMEGLKPSIAELAREPEVF